MTRSIETSQPGISRQTDEPSPNPTRAEAVRPVSAASVKRALDSFGLVDPAWVEADRVTAGIAQAISRDLAASSTTTQVGTKSEGRSEPSGDQEAKEAAASIVAAALIYEDQTLLDDAITVQNYLFAPPSTEEGGETLAVAWASEYRNAATDGEWRRSNFHAATGGLPTSREQAVALVEAKVRRWVGGTEMRAVEIVTKVASDVFVSPLPVAPHNEWGPYRQALARDGGKTA